MPNYVIELLTDVLNEINKDSKNISVGILGISYKPNVGDIQLTPIKEVIEKLKKMNFKIKIFDPFFINKDFCSIKTEDSFENTVSNCDVLILGTDHDEFLDMDYNKLKTLMNTSGIVIDTRGKLSASKIREVGLIFRGIGRIVK